MSEEKKLPRVEDVLKTSLPSGESSDEIREIADELVKDEKPKEKDYSEL